MKSLKKRKADPSSSYHKKKADAAWGKLIHLMFEEKCAFCYEHQMVMDLGTGDCGGRPEAHHLISRARIVVRHNPKIGILLCSKHHKYDKAMSPHMGPVGFNEFMEVNFPVQVEWARQMNRKAQQGKPDYKLRTECLNLLIAIAEKHGGAYVGQNMWINKGEVGKLIKIIETDGREYEVV